MAYGACCAGTMERVCVVLGSPTGIRTVLDIIVDKIRDKPDFHSVPAELKVTMWSTCEVTLVVLYSLMLHRGYHQGNAHK